MLCTASFLSVNPLIGCNEEIHKINKKGVIMTHEIIKENSFEEMKKSSDKGKFMESFSKKNTFTECKLLLEKMLSDSKINTSDKWSALEGTGSTYRKEVLDFALNSIKSEKYSLKNFKELSENDKNNLIVYSNMLSFSSGYLKQYASYISETSSTINILKNDGFHPLGVYFRGALVTRAKLTNTDEALKLSEEFMKDSSKYSLYVNSIAASAMIKIDYSKSIKVINSEVKNTSNPLKQEILKSIMEEMLKELNKTEDLLGALDDKTLKSIPKFK